MTETTPPSCDDKPAPQGKLNLRGAALGISSLWVAQVCKMGLGLAASIVTIRYLGPDNYGILAVGGAYGLLFCPLVSLPQHSLIVRELTRGSEKNQETVLSTAFDIRLAGALLQVLLSILAVGVMGYSGDIVWATGLIAAAQLSSPFLVIRSSLENDGKFPHVAMIDLCASVFGIAARLGLVAVQANVLAFAAVALVEATAQIFLYLSLRPCRWVLLPLTNFSRRLASVVIRDGWPLVLSGMAITVYMRTDVIMISLLLSEQDAGHYTAGLRLPEILYFFPIVITNVFIPPLARAHAENPKEFYQLVRSSCSFIFWLCSCLAASLSIAAPILLPMLLGPDFTSSIAVTQIAAWTIVPVGLGSAVTSYLTIDHGVRKQLYATLSGALINVLLNFLLIPKWGIHGAAVATLTAQFWVVAISVGAHKNRKLLHSICSSLSPHYAIQTLLALSKSPPP